MKNEEEDFPSKKIKILTFFVFWVFILSMFYISSDLDILQFTTGLFMGFGFTSAIFDFTNSETKIRNDINKSRLDDLHEKIDFYNSWVTDKVERINKMGE